jgi:hypothetical protein
MYKIKFDCWDVEDKLLKDLLLVEKIFVDAFLYILFTLNKGLLQFIFELFLVNLSLCFGFQYAFQEDDVVYWDAASEFRYVQSSSNCFSELIISNLVVILFSHLNLNLL